MVGSYIAVFVVEGGALTPFFFLLLFVPAVDSPISMIGVYNYVTGTYTGEITPSVVNNATFSADAMGFANVPHPNDGGNTLVSWQFVI